jgi:hypothetical protein
MITENDFLVEHIPIHDLRFQRYLETYYFKYGENEKNRNYKSYTKDKLLHDISIKRYTLGMINIWFRKQLARTFLLTNYKNWCLINRSITYFDVIKAHTISLSIPILENIIISNNLDGLLITLNKRKFHNLCFTDRIRKTKDSFDEPFLHYLHEKNYEMIQKSVSPKKLFLFNSVPQYVSYFSISGKEPDFLIPYEENTN